MVRNEKTLIEYSIPSKPSLDLHVLGTPPAFILSQDQTLIKKFVLAQTIVISKISGLVCLWFKSSKFPYMV